MEIKTQRHLAVWYECPQCKQSYAHTMLSPSKRNREYVGTCIFCDVPEVITRRRYYITWASDFYGVAGTCQETCAYYFPNIRVFKRTLAEKRAQREQEARVYMEHERQVQAEYDAQRTRQQQEAALLQEVEQIAYRRTHMVELLTEEVAQAVWPKEQIQPEPYEEDNEHPF